MWEEVKTYPHKIFFYKCVIDREEKMIIKKYCPIHEINGGRFLQDIITRKALSQTKIIDYVPW